MRLTRAHIEFWRRKKEPKAPAWFDSVKGYDERHDKERLLNIHGLVNAHAGFKPDYDRHNTLVVLRFARERGDLANALVRMSVNPGTLINPKRRKADCMKWLRKLTRP